MHDLFKDLQYGVRILIRQPAFTAVAALSLAAGIGLNTTMFSVVNAVMLRDTPVHEPERLVEIYSSASEDFPHLTSSYADYQDILAGADAFSDVAAHAMVRGILTSEGRSALVVGEVATANYFDLLGLQPELGRGFLPRREPDGGLAPGDGAESRALAAPLRRPPRHPRGDRQAERRHVTRSWASPRRASPACCPASSPSSGSPR